MKQVIQLLSQNKRTIAQVFNGSVLPSNGHFSSNVIQSNKMAPVAKPSKMLAVMYDFKQRIVGVNGSLD